MLPLLIIVTLTLTPADSVRHSGVPRRVVVIQDTVRNDEDLRDRWLGADKVKHFTMSYAITAFGYAGARTVVGHDESVIAGLGAGLAAGLLKEAYDRMRARPFSGRDFFWDLAGVGAGYAMVKQLK